MVNGSKYKEKNPEPEIRLPVAGLIFLFSAAKLPQYEKKENSPMGNPAASNYPDDQNISILILVTFVTVIITHGLTKYP